MGKVRKPYSRYSKEVKLEAVRRVLDGDEPVQQVIEELGIRHRDNVYEWIKKYNEQGERAFDRKLKVESTDKQLEELKAEVAALRKYVENVIQGIEEKYQAVDALKDQFPVETLCNALNVPKSGFIQYKEQKQKNGNENTKQKTLYFRKLSG
ncbi:transposase [Ornithinibacillus sp. L9]|uniref:Transposase n=1 Tax=Ornithinibacillus caprae TaxID=2678566 RepID=A0A6N8FGQ3_9BACI|nr:transposase [Ornithinibacillus caprae]MUK88391.1 transposase [Ornithinibacillus caprae]